MEKRDAKKYVHSLFEKIDESTIEYLQSIGNTAIYSLNSGKIINDQWYPHISANFQVSPNFIIRKGKRVKGLDRKKGILTIEGKHLSNVDFDKGYFYRTFPDHTCSEFLCERGEKEGGFYPVKFIFKNNTIEGFDAQSLNHEEGPEFEGNCITGAISGLSADSKEEHSTFLKKNEMVGEVGFSDCVFKKQILKGMTIKELSRVTATERLLFEDCEIMETDFWFRECPIVQFLGKTRIGKIKNIYKINSSDYLNEVDGVRDVYFSEQFDIDNHTPEEKQYFFKQMRLFQDKRSDRVQALFAYKKYLEQELKLNRLQWKDKCIIYASKLFGSGLNFVRPFLILVFSFSVFCVLTWSFDISFLFPMFPHIMFEKTANIKTLFDSFPYHLNLLRHPFSLLYYILLILSWYFIIKSLHKFTYKK